MNVLQQVQQDIQTLSPEALSLVAQFVQLLQKNLPVQRISSSDGEPVATLAPEDAPPAPEDWSDFIGCMSAEEDLSVNYKAYWGAGLEEKYGHR